MIRRLLLSVVLLCSVSSLAQMTGELYLDKEVYAPGEAVYLNFRLTNHDAIPHETSQKDPNGSCSPYTIRISSDPPEGASCTSGIMFTDCLFGGFTLAPGETGTERVLLNYRHRIGAPGDYGVEVSRGISYGDEPRSLTHFSHSTEAKATLHFRVDAGRTLDPSSVQTLVAELSSPDYAKRRDAELTLAATAPRELEDTIIALATAKRANIEERTADQSPCELPAVSAVREFQEFAPMVLFNLHTERSLAALAEMLVRYGEGANYLVDTGDQRWIPLLREKARNDPNRFAADVARMQGDDSIPFLLDLMQRQKLRPGYAVYALGQTGSPRAVPILIELLNSKDFAASEALRALRLLTRKSVEGNWRQDPASQYHRWKNWWQKSQNTAPIYKADECGEVSILP